MKVAFVSLRPSAPIAKFDRKEVVASVTGEKEGTGSVQLPLAASLEFLGGISLLLPFLGLRFSAPSQQKLGIPSACYDPSMVTAAEATAVSRTSKVSTP